VAKRSIEIVLVVLTTIYPALCQSGDQPLPDCPSAQVARQVPKWSGVNSLASIAPERNASLVRIFQIPNSDQTQEEISRMRKWFYPAGVKRSIANSPSDADDLLGRAARAASQTILTRDDSGRSRLNTAYLLRTLTSVAADSAAKPYWRRSPTDPAGNFGSAVGNDAGTNLWHEFGPGIEHAMKSYTPKFLTRIVERSGASNAGNRDAGIPSQMPR
jgi:hypothetical protein